MLMYMDAKRFGYDQVSRGKFSNRNIRKLISFKGSIRFVNGPFLVIYSTGSDRRGVQEV